MVAGISRMELAKIGGITPEVLIFSGICVESPPNIRLPTWRFGYCTGIAPLRALHEHDERHHRHRQHQEARMKNGDSAPVRPSSSREASALRQVGDDAGHDDQAVPLPTPRAVICSPSHIRNIVPPTSVMTQESGRTCPG